MAIPTPAELAAKAEEKQNETETAQNTDINQKEEPQEAVSGVEAPEDTPEAVEEPESEEPEADESVSKQEGDPNETEEGETFPRKYVEELRAESAKYRVEARKAEEYGERLQQALVAQDGRLAAPEDLPYDPALLDDPEALEAAVTAYIEKYPNMRSVRAGGDIGQGNVGVDKPQETDLISIIRGMQ